MSILQKIADIEAEVINNILILYKIIFYALYFRHAQVTFAVVTFTFPSIKMLPGLCLLFLWYQILFYGISILDKLCYSKVIWLRLLILVRLCRVHAL